MLSIKNQTYVQNLISQCGGGTIRPLSRDGGVEELSRDQQSGHAPKSGSEIKN